MTDSADTWAEQAMEELEPGPSADPRMTGRVLVRFRGLAGEWESAADFTTLLSRLLACGGYGTDHDDSSSEEDAGGSVLAELHFTDEFAWDGMEHQQSASFAAATLKRALISALTAANHQEPGDAAPLQP